VLVAGGYSAILLGVFYLIVDVWQARAWCQPFVWMGMNSITIYLASNIIGGFFLAYRLLGGKSEIATGPVKTDSTSAAPQGAGANPYARYIEVAGIRIIEDEKQQIKATFVVVNHSAADMPSQDLQITLRSSTAKPEDDPVAVVAIKTGPLAANASKDLSVPLKTTLRAYELPDWQFLRASVEVLPQH